MAKRNLIALEVCLITFGSFTLIFFLQTRSTKTIIPKFLYVNKNKGVADQGPLIHPVYCSLKTRFIARLVQRQDGKIYWTIFQLAELVFFRASTCPEEDQTISKKKLTRSLACPLTHSLTHSYQPENQNALQLTLC